MGLEIVGGETGGKQTTKGQRRRWMYNVSVDLIGVDVDMWTGLGWTRIGTYGGPL